VIPVYECVYEQFQKLVPFLLFSFVFFTMSLWEMIASIRSDFVVM